MKAEEKFTKKQLDAIAIVDKLYSLQKDVDLARSILQQKKLTFCRLQTTKVEFNHVLPSMFISLVEAIERGDLIWKEETK